MKVKTWPWCGACAYLQPCERRRQLGVWQREAKRRALELLQVRRCGSAYNPFGELVRVREHRYTSHS